MAARFRETHLRVLRAMRSYGSTMHEICMAFPNHTRDQVLELIDASIRHQSDNKALIWVNGVMEMQRAQIPLVNGRRASWSPVRETYRPMF